MTPSPSPAAVAATVALDPTLLAILSIFGGAALTVIAGFFGAWIQSRREHSRWIRERRLEAFTALVTMHNEYESAEIASTYAQGNPAALASYVAQLEAIREGFPRAITPLAILGPPSVSDAADEYTAASNAKDRDAMRVADAKMVAAMRKALGIRD